MFTLAVDDDIQLALVQPSFAPLYLDIVSDQRDYLSQWLAWPNKAYSEEFFLNFIQGALRGYADGKSMTCALLYKQQLVGNISFNNIDADLKVATVGYWLSADFQGNGIVSRAVAYLIDYAFTELNMEKVQIAAAVDNQASRAVCERLNLTLEGVITRAERLGDRVFDHAVYAAYKAESADS